MKIITTASRLLLQNGGHTIGELDFVLADRQMRIDHVGVRPEYRGQGLAKQLVDATAALARQEGWTILPVCPYAQKVLARNPAHAGLIITGKPS